MDQRRLATAHDRSQVDSSTYRILKGEITQKEYEKIRNDQRVRHGLPPLERQAAAER